jgi:parvulin-like peptidyl-prolyl isomerase
MKALSLLSLVLCTAGLAQLVHAADPAKFTLPDPVAVVEGKDIKAADVEKALNSMIKRAGKADSDVSADQKLQASRQIINDLIIQQLLKTRAADTKVDDAEVDARYGQFAAQPQFAEQLKANNSTPEKAKEQLREMIREHKWVDSQLGAKTEVSDADIKAFYDAHPSAFDAPETIRASHILISVPADAKPEVVAEKQKAIDAAAQRVSKGEDFAKVANELTQDPGNNGKGGDLGFFPKTAMVPEFAEAAFALKQNEVSKVVKTKYGFHIIKLTDHKDAHKISFDEAKPKLAAYLSQQKQSELTKQFLNDLKAKAAIKNNLPAETPSAPAPATGSPAAKAATPAPQAESK